MNKTYIVLAFLVLSCSWSLAQNDSEFQLALPRHLGQLRWTADGFKIVESSAKPSGNEIGIRGKNEAEITFLGFLFLFPEKAPLTSAKCRDGIIDPEKKSNPSLKIQSTSEISSGNVPVSLVSYTLQEGGGKLAYVVRGFVASGDMCGDLEVYSDTPIVVSDQNIRGIFETYRLEKEYSPTFNDVFVYGQILYAKEMYKPAGPILELALQKLTQHPGDASRVGKRIVTDEAGMAYGISGDIPKARAIFEKAIAEDPDYPLYYYNLACADAEEKNLVGARKHLEEAFARQANVNPGEQMPNPLEDDSFLPHRNDREFWAFLNSLQQKQRCSEAVAIDKSVLWCGR